MQPFHKWASDALPAVEGGDVFSYDEEGFPIFPDVELSELTGKDVQILVRGFLTKIWGE